jgi:outer membrane protein assembly factor BamB
MHPQPHYQRLLVLMALLLTLPMGAGSAHPAPILKVGTCLLAWWQFCCEAAHTGFFLGGTAATSIRSLRQRWVYRLTSIAVSASHLLIATGNTQVVALNPRTGHRQWTYAQSHHQAKGIAIGLAAAYGLVYVAGLGHGPQLLALDVASGQLSWTFVARGSATLDPSVANGVLYVSDTRADLYAVNAKTGRRIAVIGHLQGTHSQRIPPSLITGSM